MRAPKSGKARRDWAEKYGELLGKLPDREVAHLAGVGCSCVKKVRLRRGIHFKRLRYRPWKPKDDELLGKYTDMVRPWTAEEEALIGTVPDRVVAKKTGRSVRAVKHRRVLLGIPNRFDVLDRPWTATEVGLLGRLLIISAFHATETRITADLAARRNAIVAALATETLILHAAPGGRLETSLRQKPLPAPPRR